MTLRRTLPAAATALVLSLGLAGCGGGDDEKKSSATASDKASSATDGSSAGDDASSGDGASAGAAGKAKGTQEFCGAVQKVIGVMSTIKGELPDEGEWKKIQKEYAGLGDVDLPADASKDQQKGREVITKAITSLDYADAKKAFGSTDASSAIPGVSAADNKLAVDFLTYAGTTCAAAAGQ